MTSEEMPNVAAVSCPFGEEPPRIHCPLCGQPSVTIVDGAGEITPCPHLAFIFASAIGDFAYQSEEFKARAATADEEDWNVEDFGAALAAAGYGEHLLAMSVTYGGMACGPVHYTDVFGFDFSISTRSKA